MQYFLARAPRSCLAPSIVAIVFAILFLGTLIAVIILATTSTCDTTSSFTAPSTKSSSSSSSSSSEPPEVAVSFTEFIAESYTITFFKEATDNYRVGNTQKEYVFDDYKWFQEVYYDDGIFSRVFSTDDDDTITVCKNLSTHSYCYRQTSRQPGRFFIPYDIQLKVMGQPCYELFPELKEQLPSRSLDKCDFYGLQIRDEDVLSVDYYSFSNDKYMYWLVESDTNYPVMKQIKYSGEGYSQMILYTSFKPGKPDDESGLKPLPGVNMVYDFRDGHGDVDESKFHFNAALNNNSKKSNRFNSHMKSVRQNKLLRELLHLPLMGVSPITPSRVSHSAVLRDPSSIPKEFDARTHWSNCANIIGTITDQSICGSCWAMASAGVLSDRLCISKNITEQLSPQYLVYCGEHSNGCQGGITIPAWDDLIDQGTVSESCVPFTGRYGECPNTCKDYSQIDDDIKIFPTGYVFPWGNTNESRVQAIQSEIMTNGPVMTSFQEFNDFQDFFDEFPDGVYHRSKEATNGGGHAVRIIGWGTTEEGEDYWLVANSWGKDFADGGVFRIRRGNNECNIEEEVGGLVL